jgi:murein DD-endopeptidase MepM/ murein hydrolase activator NlpD
LTTPAAIALGPPSLTAELQKGGKGEKPSPEKLRAVCQELESLFLYRLLQEMRATVPEGPLHGEGEDVYQSIADQQVAMALAKGGGMGLADMLFKQLSGEKLNLPRPVSPATGAEQYRRFEPATEETLRAPVRGQVTSGFGLREDPIDGSTRYHRGVDIAAPEGTPIRPAASGKVVFSGPRGGYGNLVIVEHEGGVQTCYGHCSKLLVAAGEEVTPGRSVALVGQTGRATGPHLHFEVRREGEAVNPMAMLRNARPVGA